jgi:hypothetical protein
MLLALLSRRSGSPLALLPFLVHLPLPSSPKNENSTTAPRLPSDPWSKPLAYSRFHLYHYTDPNGRNVGDDPQGSI